ncbi:MAG: cytochrome b/b6 domain-containing protein [Planctomycetales bacterium]|nr:cytochrome b/b6 domain-containing protein [Planctomycetales bacterium]
MSFKRVLVYTRFERFWHWLQAMLILFLALTGFEIHSSYRFFGFDQAVRYHSAAAVVFMVLIAFTIFWHFTTGEWRQYLPTGQMLRAQVEYYLVGIFRHAPHPTKKTVLSKLNPLQKLTYLALKLLVIPVMVTSGLLYMFYRYPQRHGIETLNVGGLEAIAIVHTLGAFCLIAFVIAHVYLTTTGRTMTSNLEAMITGYEELEEDTHASPEVTTSTSDTAGRSQSASEPSQPKDPSPPPRGGFRYEI